MATSGMYDAAGDWLYDVGLPAKSGVAGGLIAVLPGRSVSGCSRRRWTSVATPCVACACARSSRGSLDLHMFNHDHGRPSPVRRTFTLAEMTSRRVRDPSVSAAILRDGLRVRAFELQGDVGFAEAEQIEARRDRRPRRVRDSRPAPRARYPSRRRSTCWAVSAITISALSAAPQELRDAVSVPAFDELDRALEWCEDRLTGDTEAPSLPSVRAHPCCATSARRISRASRGCSSHRTFAPGERPLRAGEPVTELFLLTRGVASETLDAADGRDTPRDHRHGGHDSRRNGIGRRYAAASATCAPTPRSRRMRWPPTRLPDSGRSRCGTACAAVAEVARRHRSAGPAALGRV